MTSHSPAPKNSEYFQHHPNAIVDPVKAEYMAYGTKELEVAANDLGKRAFEASLLESMSADGYGEYAGISPAEARVQQDAAKDQGSFSKLSILALAKRREADDAARKIAKGYDIQQYAKGNRRLPPV